MFPLTPRTLAAFCPIGAVVAVVGACVSGACANAPAPNARATSAGAPFTLAIPGEKPDCAAGAADAPSSSVSAGGAAGSDSSCVAVAERDYATDVAPVLSACHGEVCHGNTFLKLSLLRAVVGAPAAECCGARQLITPGHPEQSYVLDKVSGERLCSGARMPLGGPYLTASQIQILSDWICEGAPLPAP